MENNSAPIEYHTESIEHEHESRAQRDCKNDDFEQVIKRARAKLNAFVNDYRNDNEPTRIVESSKSNAPCDNLCASQSPNANDCVQSTEDENGVPGCNGMLKKEHNSKSIVSHEALVNENNPRSYEIFQNILKIVELFRNLDQFRRHRDPEIVERKLVSDCSCKQPVEPCNVCDDGPKASKDAADPTTVQSIETSTEQLPKEPCNICDESTPEPSFIFRTTDLPDTTTSAPTEPCSKCEEVLIDQNTDSKNTSSNPNEPCSKYGLSNQSIEPPTQAEPCLDAPNSLNKTSEGSAVPDEPCFICDENLIDGKNISQTIPSTQSTEPETTACTMCESPAVSTSTTVPDDVPCSDQKTDTKSVHTPATAEPWTISEPIDGDHDNQIVPAQTNSENLLQFKMDNTDQNHQNVASTSAHLSTDKSDNQAQVKCTLSKL